jgi:lipid-A-disaccharide synthase
MMPVFAEVEARLRQSRPDLAVAVTVGESVAWEVAEASARLEVPPVLVRPSEGEAGKQVAFAAADLALVTSGTVVLEMAAAATPMVSAYRTSWLTGAILRRLIRVDSANLVNLVSGEWIVPEFLQENCTAARIAPALTTLLEEPSDRAGQLAAFEDVLIALGRGGVPPSVRAARSVLKVLG